MKILKVFYYPLMLVFLICGLLYGSREFFLLFLIQAFIVVCGTAMNIWTVFSFSYVQTLSRSRCVKGDTLNLNIRISNEKPLPFTLMRIKIETVAYHDAQELVFDLPPFDRISFDIPVTCPYRGSYSVGMTILEVNDLFGLTRLRFDLRKLFFYRQCFLTVYPRLVELSFLPSENPDAKFFSGARLKLSDEGETFAGSRKYRAGDSLKRINWKQSVRKRELFTKVYEEPMQARTLLAIDNAAFFSGEDKLLYADLACECAAAIIRHSLKMGHGVRLISSSEKQTLSADNIHGFGELYDHLATMRFDDSSQLRPRLRLESVATGGYHAIYIITSNPTAELASAIREIQTAACSAICLIISNGSSIAGSAVMNGVSCHTITFGEDIAQIFGG